MSPELESSNNTRSNNCGWVSMLTNYLEENKLFECCAIGDSCFGVIRESKFNIPANSFIKITSINENKWIIDWVEKEMDPVLLEAIAITDYDFRFFKLLELPIHTTTIKLEFTVV